MRIREKQGNILKMAFGIFFLKFNQLYNFLSGVETLVGIIRIPFLSFCTNTKIGKQDDLLWWSTKTTHYVNLFAFF